MGLIAISGFGVLKFVCLFEDRDFGLVSRFVAGLLVFVAKGCYRGVVLWVGEVCEASADVSGSV